MTLRAADDADVIGRRIAELRSRDDFYRARRCALRSGGAVTVAECWCKGAGPNGSTLPCPPLDEENLA